MKNIFIYIINANTIYIYISFWSYKSTERAYELGHHLAGCDPKNVLDHPGSFTKSEWQGQTKEVLKCFQLAMQQCFWVLDIFCRPAAWMRLMMRLDPNVVGSCWIYRSCLHDLCWNSSPRPWYFQGGGTIVWNIFFLMGTEAPLAICRGCVLGPTRWESHCQLTAALPVTPPFFPWDPIR